MHSDMSSSRFIAISVTSIVVAVAIIAGFPAMSSPVVTSERGAVVFMYHRFGEDRLPSTNIRMDQFIEQLDFLEKNNFSIWPLSKIVDHLHKEKEIPDRTVAITIDDAYLSVYTNAFPVLKERGIPFTVFVSTLHVDKKYSRYMSWAQLSEMMRFGAEIGNHSTSHKHLIRDQQSYDEWKQYVVMDVTSSARRIKQELGVEPVLFAYPYGEYSVELAEIINELGWTGFGQQSGAIGKYSNFSYLPRFPVSEHYSDMAQFKSKALSLALPVSRVSPEEPVWRSNQSAPELKLEIDGKALSGVNCFASGRGRVHAEVAGANILVKTDAPFTSRRFRYNCTLATPEAGRFYWYSHLWINPAVPEQ